MKEKISITLSREVLAEIDRLAGKKRSRSESIEEVLAQYLRNQARIQRDAREIAIINQNLERLNREALDGLDDQAAVGEFPEK